ADARGFLEFPRELPGFLTALFAGLLFFLPETMIGAACALCVGFGMIGISVWGASWHTMLAFMILWSTGTHLLMPVRSSVGIHLADEKRRGRRLGQIAGAGIGATLLGCGVVWIGMKYLGAGHSTIFLVGGLAALAAGPFFAAMRLPGAHLKRSRFVWNRRYWLYYVLALLFGARKQIFITFGPWVLVRVFKQPAYVIAQLWMAAAALGMFVQPVLGRVIDRFGERKVLVADSLLVLAVCVGYGFSARIAGAQFALWLLYACYVGDHLLFGVNMARTTYLSKIVVKPEDLAPTLSLGITINHAVSMSVPAIGGLIWVRHGYEAVFAAAGGVALLMLLFSLCLRIRPAAPGH
ncbi:MAG: MFS transporter, partial [Lentisphaerae bacterium]|nr:MFS transporter [Lentisphaerota bacterium]